MNNIFFFFFVREFFSKRILPTLKKMTADKSSQICALSLLLTTLSVFPQLGFIGYACIALDGYCLIDAFHKHEIM